MVNPELKKPLSKRDEIHTSFHDRYGGDNLTLDEKKSRILRDKKILSNALRKYQKIKGVESIDEWRLCELCEMSFNWFEFILHQVLRDSNFGVVRFSSGKIGFR